MAVNILLVLVSQLCYNVFFCTGVPVVKQKCRLKRKKIHILPTFSLSSSSLSLYTFFFHNAYLQGSRHKLRPVSACSPWGPVSDVGLISWRGRGGVSPDSLSKWLIAPTPPSITPSHPSLPLLPRAGRGPSASFLCGSETEITSGRGCAEERRSGASGREGERGGRSLTTASMNSMQRFSSGLVSQY